MTSLTKEMLLLQLNAAGATNTPQACTAVELAKRCTAAGTKTTRSEVNQILYRLDKEKICTRTTDQPPRWSLAGSAAVVVPTSVHIIAVPIVACKLCGCSSAACRANLLETKTADAAAERSRELASLDPAAATELAAAAVELSIAKCPLSTHEKSLSD